MDIYQDRVEIGNPGGLYGGRTVANLDEGIPVSRNKVLANLLRSVPRPYGRGVVAEAAGTGVPRMIGSMRQQGLPAPDYEATTIDRVTVKLSRFGLLDPDVRAWLDSLPGGPRGTAADSVLALARRDGKVRAVDVRRNLGLDSDDVRDLLGELVAEGLLVGMNDGPYVLADLRLRMAATGARWAVLSVLDTRKPLKIQDIAERTGTPIVRVNEFWRALGFPTPDPGAVVFSERDLDVFSQWHDLVESGAIDTATSRSLLRANSHLADRLALWQYEALVEDSSRRLMLDDTTARMYVLDHMREYIDVFQEMFVYSWRRQLEATLSRFDREVSQRGHEERHSRFPLNRCLGFVDMVSYTSSSTILGDSLVGLIERFEEESRTAVIEEGGRVVKMIGDAVLYIADDLPTGLRVATALIERLNADDEMLPVRASFVRGDVFSRSGDVFGPTVNLASRLVDIAPVGKILTDPATAAAIAAGKGGEGYGLEEFPTADLRGFGPVSPYLLSSRVS